MSRFKKPSGEKFVEDRRKICAVCPWNSKNIEYKKIPRIKRFLIKLSNFYDWLTNSKPEDLGNCTTCDSCSIYYKTPETLEHCPKGKWNEVDKLNNIK